MLRRRFTRQPALLAVDFDQTLTREDTSVSLIEAAIETLDEAQRPAKHEALHQLSSSFYASHRAKVTSVLESVRAQRTERRASRAAPERAERAFDVEEARAFAEGMAPFDRAMLRPVRDPPPSRTKRTRRVPHPVQIGHAAPLTPCSARCAVCHAAGGCGRRAAALLRAAPRGLRSPVPGRSRRQPTPSASLNTPKVELM